MFDLEFIRSRLLSTHFCEREELTIISVIAAFEGHLVTYRVPRVLLGRETSYDRVAFMDFTGRFQWDNICA